MKKTILLFTLIAAAVIAGAVWYNKKTPAQAGELDGFAQCLRGKGAVMYGAEWCPHCQNEKKAFGKSFRFVNYVECPVEPQKCLSAGINGYPTWIFPGNRRFEGEQGLQKLSLESGCSLAAESQSDIAAPAARSGELKSDSGEGGVTAQAEFKEENGKFVFNLALDTHSVNLDGFDPMMQVALETEKGDKMTPEKLKESGGGHHREFTLAFPSVAGAVKLVVSELSGAPKREITWTD